MQLQPREWSQGRWRDCKGTICTCRFNAIAQSPPTHNAPGCERLLPPPWVRKAPRMESHPLRYIQRHTRSNGYTSHLHARRLKQHGRHGMGQGSKPATVTTPRLEFRSPAPRKYYHPVAPIEPEAEANLPLRPRRQVPPCARGPIRSSAHSTSRARNIPTITPPLHAPDSQIPILRSQTRHPPCLPTQSRKAG